MPVTHEKPSVEAVVERIEALWGRPIAELRAEAEQRPESMLAALVEGHDALHLADRAIDQQRQRLHELTSPQRTFDGADTGHILDCSRRIADFTAIRDTHIQVLTAVLRGLRRVPEPTAPAPTRPASPTRSAAPSR
ncbi:hypothetical protein [Streptomyces sp. RFCAC02]|uniref:hypothetical protein n=1 Tax=Streptomyces sp. RFCAC02 TaxID=2499143 RepID=UPI001020AC95|nr:hypothetical protein [Streptomyces sp. RFCAC02]